ncbi:MAG: hypothetical protein JW943_13930, partial [Deltaproteobacteria bacterium]|nr:hypothetical protein [Deltaproteobacteria bacterium]
EKSLMISGFLPRKMRGRNDMNAALRLFTRPSKWLFVKDCFALWLPEENRKKPLPVEQTANGFTACMNVCSAAYRGSTAIRKARQNVDETFEFLSFLSLRGTEVPWQSLQLSDTYEIASLHSP